MLQGSQKIKRAYQKVKTFNYIEKNPFIYQLHLEKIADFLLIEGAWKVTEEGI